jgi:ribose-phosphate pyrophosphokinase
MDSLKIFSGGASQELASKIAQYLNIEVGVLERVRFSDGEIWIKFNENIRGNDVFLIQSLYPPAEHILELLFMIDAAKRASAKRITAVIPYFCYARQDRKDQPRVAISARVIADLITKVGADRVLTMDLHAAQIQGFFSIPLDHLYASYLFVDYFRQKKIPELKLAAPDIGAVKMAGYYAQRMDAELIVVDKRRPRPNEAYVQSVIGEVEGRNVVILDDLVDTAGSLCAAAQALKERGAKKIFACCSHGLLSGNAMERIEASPISELVITDSVPLRAKKVPKKIKVISTAPMVGEAIKRIHFEQSISSLFV